MGQFVTTITLDHTFTTGIPNALQPSAPAPVPQIIQRPAATTRAPAPIITSRFPSPLPAQTTQSAPQIASSNQITAEVVDSLNNVNFQCGKPDFREPSVTGLVIGGYQAVRGQFPW